MSKAEVFCDERRSAYDELPHVQGLDWSGLKPLTSTAPDATTIVIPVYGAVTETLHCIHSVLRAETSVEARLVVIDDHSPDVALYETLLALSDGGRLFALQRNERNRGFVHTANSGLLASHGDVILLNSDTIVTDGWIDRLVAVARSSSTVASVSPLTNNATILSYPHINKENGLVDDLSLTDLAGLFAANRALLEPVETPVNVGFCMLITQAALQEIGGFDEGLFGIGYGEECDWCMRATSAGFKHLVAVDTYVYHLGSVSFSAKAIKRQDLAARALAQKHPDYWPAIGQFCATDPLFAARRLVDIERFKLHLSACNGLVVHVLHALGGGTQVYSRDVADMLAANGYESIFLQPDPNGRLVISAHSMSDLPNMVFSCGADRELAASVLAALPIVRLHVHAMIGFSPAAASFVRGIEGPMTFTLHDYVPICPQITLLDHKMRYCDVPPPTACNVCLRERPAPLASKNIATWRRDWHAILARADHVIAPSAFVQKTVGGVFPDLRIDVVPHHEDHAFPPVERRALDRADANRALPRQIAIFGNINDHKGLECLRACAEDARTRDLPLEFLLFGSATLDETDYKGKLTKMGSYRRAELPALLAQTRCDIGFLPSVWPETYSYVLSEFLDLGLHPVVFDLGAQADRLRLAKLGSILDIGTSAGDINDMLMTVIPLGFKARRVMDPESSPRRYLSRIYGAEMFP